jgi:hypothetical protein
MKYALTILVMSLLIAISCSTEEAVETDHILLHEDATKGKMKINMQWTVNGEKDDGTKTDVSLYLTRSIYEDKSVRTGIDMIRFGSSDLYGGKTITPTGFDDEMYDFYRYYVGVAFNGVVTEDPVSFPLTINYSIDISFENDPAVAKNIQGEFVVTEEEATITKISYQYFFDITESEADVTYRSYSWKKMDEPALISRESDVIETTTFTNEELLTAELTWTVDGEVAGYENADLDLVIHNTNTAASNMEGLDFHTATDHYERITIAALDPTFKTNIPERVGFYFRSAGTTPVAIKYQVKIIQRGGEAGTRLRRFIVNGSFTSPPQVADNGKYYFVANISRAGNIYTAKKLASVLEW